MCVAALHNATSGKNGSKGPVIPDHIIARKQWSTLSKGLENKTNNTSASLVTSISDTKLKTLTLEELQLVPRYWSSILSLQCPQGTEHLESARGLATIFEYFFFSLRIKKHTSFHIKIAKRLELNIVYN